MQKPPDLDASGNPITNTNKPPDLDISGNPTVLQTIQPEPIVEQPVVQSEVVQPQVDDRSGLHKFWDFATTPLTDLPSRLANQAADRMTEPSLIDSPTGEGGFTDRLAIIGAQIRGLKAGIGQGIGNVVSGFSSPLNLATMGAGTLESVAAKYGLPAVAQLANIGLRTLSAPVAAEGAYHIATGDTTSERLMGIPELAGGLAGMKSKLPAIANRTAHIPEPIASTPEVASSMGRIEPILDNSGRPIAPPQTDIPIRPEGPWTNNTPQTIDMMPPIEPPINVTPQFNRRGQLGETGNLTEGALQRIGKDIVNPHTGEIIDLNEPVTPSNLTYGKFEGMPGSKLFDEMAASYDDEITTKSGKNSVEMMKEIEKEVQAERLPKREYKGLRETDSSEIQQAIKDWHDTKTVMDPEQFDNQGNFIPRRKQIESSEVKGTSGTKPSNIEILKSGEATPIKVKQMKEAGFELQEMTEDGDLIFKQTGKKTKQPILESEVKNIKPTKSTEKAQLGPNIDEKKSLLTEIINSPRTIMASVDMSAPLRQGLPLALKSEFWSALPGMVKAWGSERAFNEIQATIAEKPLFKKRMGVDGKELQSFADQAGLKLTNIHGNIMDAEEAFLASHLSKLPGIKHANRAYVAFLNKLRADTFESLVRDGKVFGANAEANVPLARALADFVNTGTGRGSLGKLEPAAKILSNTFFAPRLIASRLKLLNPHYYITANPIVRKEAAKALFTVAASGIALGQLARFAGAKVSSDRNSADFGKIRFGNVHIDPFAGFQQYIVAASRIQSGKSTSTTTGNTYTLGQKFGRPTRLDVAARFAESKLNPIYTLALDILRGKDFTGQPVNIPEEVASRFVPLFIQDVKQLLTEDPNLIPGIHKKSPYKEMHPENLLAAPGAFFGQGVQVYKGRYR